MDVKQTSVVELAYRTIDGRARLEVDDLHSRHRYFGGTKTLGEAIANCSIVEVAVVVHSVFDGLLVPNYLS